MANKLKYNLGCNSAFKVVEQFKLVESSTASGRPEFSKMVDFVKKQGG
jgi:hypothetical protein